MKTTIAAFALACASFSPAFAEPTKLTKAQLVDANKIVMNAYPGPFDATFKQVVAKLGAPQKKSANMNQWFALDGGKCVQFFMTKDAQKGYAAGSVGDTEATDCK